MSGPRYCGEPVVFTDYDIERAERHRAKGYEEHASYPIEISLPQCGYCAGVAARCGCKCEGEGDDGAGYIARFCDPNAPLVAFVEAAEGSFGVLLERARVELVEASIAYPGRAGRSDTSRRACLLRGVRVAIALGAAFAGSRHVALEVHSDVGELTDTAGDEGVAASSICAALALHNRVRLLVSDEPNERAADLAARAAHTSTRRLRT